MKYLSAVQAAQRLGVSEKTVRRWAIQEHKLEYEHPAKNRIYIPESEVERLKHERAKYQLASSPEQEERTQERTQDIASLIARIEQLEQDRASLIARIEQLERERISPVPTTSTEPTDTPARAERTTTPHERTPRQRAATTSTEDTSPAPGAIRLADFANMYGVPRSTFRDHIVNGLGRGEEKEKALVFSRSKPGRPEKEKEYWILPEQVQGVLDYWQRHNVKVTLPASESNEEEQ